MKPYTYLIGWSTLNRFYYGVRFSKKCHPDDLFKSYFTSSLEVKRMIEKHGSPDIIQIRKTFKSALEARKWEHKVLRRMKVVESIKWLNKTEAGAVIHTKKTIEKMMTRQKEVMLEKYGVEYSSQRAEFANMVKETKLRKYGNAQYTNIEKSKETNLKKYGKEFYSQTEEAKERKRKKSLEKYGSSCPINSKEIQEKIKQNNLIKYGIEDASQTKEAITKRKQTLVEKYGVDNIFKSPDFKKTNALKTKNFWANAPIIECSHCKKQLTNRGNYNRYHGDKCKHKLND
jgi:hypothetical protein